VVYLGVWGAPETAAAYRRWLAAWLAVTAPEPVVPTLGEVVPAFLAWADDYYERGKEAVEMRRSVQHLLDACGHLPVTALTPARLLDLQAVLARRLCRRVANQRVSRIKHCLKWLAVRELMPSTHLPGLLALEGLRRGGVAHPAVGPVTWATLTATLPELPEAAVRWCLVAWWSGARPGELCAMRPCDLDTAVQPWAYVPATHKTAHRGHTRIVYLGPRAQAVLTGHLPADPRAPVFCYSPASIGRALRRACDRAGIPRWAPNQLRHAAATRLRAEVGIETARVVLGHRSAGVTEIYAERDLSLAQRASLDLG
jgi:integrase